MVLVLMVSLVACSTTKNNDKSKSNHTADISSLMKSEPSDLDDATALYQKLMQKENEILSSNSQLWEKVFMSANKDTPMIKDGTNYGDFLLNTIENGKDNFTADELKILKDGANQIKKIEGKLTTLEQKYPGCGSKPSEGESVDAESAGMVSDKSKLTKFPSFKGKDLDGNDVNSDDIFSSNKVTVINFWFTTCNPCVGELGDLEKLNKELAQKGGTVIGINSFTLGGDKTAISEAKDVLTKKGITYKNIWFDSNSEAGKFASGLYSYPTTYVVDKNGNIVGQPIVGAITSSSQAKQLNKLIDKAFLPETFVSVNEDGIVSYSRHKEDVPVVTTGISAKETSNGDTTKLTKPTKYEAIYSDETGGDDPAEKAIKDAMVTGEVTSVVSKKLQNRLDLEKENEENMYSTKVTREDFDNDGWPVDKFSEIEEEE